MSPTAKRPRAALFAAPVSVGNLGVLFPPSRAWPMDASNPRLSSCSTVCVAASARARAARLEVSKLQGTLKLQSKVARKGVIAVEVSKPSNAGVAAPAKEDPDVEDAQAGAKEPALKVAGRRRLSEETKRKIAETMMGRPKSIEMRAKVSEKMKGRVPWNKGKKLSAEIRARMSEARSGRMPWNKGRELSTAHRMAISAGTSNRAVSEATRMRMRMARRRPGDAIVAGGIPAAVTNGAYPLVDTADIHKYVTLRRELRGWSDDFAGRNGRRPSLADVRRVAPPEMIRKFEVYTGMRDRIRGLAGDVYGSMNPEAVPVVIPRDTASSPQNNNSGTELKYTSNGHPRLVPKTTAQRVDAGGSGTLLDDNDSESRDWESGKHFEASDGSRRGQWDEYDVPVRGDYSSGFRVGEGILIPKQKKSKTTEEFSVNDYRLIGKYRLMEAIDINKYVELRRDLTAWSEKFKAKNGHIPALSDVRSSGESVIYSKFCRYIEARDRMDGLVKEVCGTDVLDVEKIKELSNTGRALVDRLRPKSPPKQLPPDEPVREATNVNAGSKSDWGRP